MSVEVTVYGGAKTIGGSKIHLQTSDTGLFLDFGADFKAYGWYFEEFLSPRIARGIYDLLALNIIPPFEKIYRSDIFPPDLKIKSGLRPKVNAVFLSHAHIDHTGDVGLLDLRIPVYASAMTAVIAKAMQDCGGTPGFWSEVAYTSPRGLSNAHPLALTALRGSPCLHRQFYLVDKPENFDGINRFWQQHFGSKVLEGKPLIKSTGSIGDLRFEAMPVDHSIFGATSYAFDANGLRLVYTGDFRLHGMDHEISKRFIAWLKQQQPHVLIVEGTNMGSQKSMISEETVLFNTLEAVKQAAGRLVIADFGPRNIERLSSFLKIAAETSRQLVITAKDAFMLYAMKMADSQIPDVLTDPHLLIFAEIMASPRLWERDFIQPKFRAKYINATTINQNQSDYILAFSFWDIKHLLDVMPKGGIYIYSTSEAFTEEQRIDIWRLSNWLECFDIKPVGFRMAHKGQSLGDSQVEFVEGFHSSGHISQEELIEFIEEIRPQKVIPVHTEHPELFKEKLSSDFEVILPETGQSIRI